jgi:invasion protein IalB
VARLGFTQAEIDEFKRGASATVRLVPAASPGEEVVLPLSLTGFTAGFTSTDATE